MPKAAKVKSEDNTSILEYALSHLERESAEIQAKIAHVKRQLGFSARLAASPAVVAPHVAEEPAPAAAATRGKRVLSPAARKRIALAQRKRWAAHRKAKAGKE